MNKELYRVYPGGERGCKGTESNSFWLASYVVSVAITQPVIDSNAKQPQITCKQVNVAVFQ